MASSVAALVALAGVVTGATITTKEPSLPDIRQAQATTAPLTWTSNVTGKAYDRFYQIWLENVVCIRACMVYVS